MHYANGREAKNGDTVVYLPAGEGSWNKPTVGILTDAVAGIDSCNGSLSVPNKAFQMGCVNLAECLHADDVKAAIADIRAVKDTSKAAA